MRETPFVRSVWNVKIMISGNHRHLDLLRQVIDNPAGFCELAFKAEIREIPGNHELIGALRCRTEDGGQML